MNVIILKGMKTVIPHKLRREMLVKIHVGYLGYLGIEKCRRRAREDLYWPGMNQSISEMVKVVRRVRNIDQSKHHNH